MSWWRFFRSEYRTAEGIVFLMVLALGLLIAWGMGYPILPTLGAIAYGIYAERPALFVLLGCVLLVRIGLDIYQRYYPKPISDRFFIGFALVAILVCLTVDHYWD
jgi:hypothetical protein